MIYLDHAAAAAVSPELAALMADHAVRWHANPEAAHAAGQACRRALADAAEKLCATLAPDGGYQAFWTPSATDAMALLGEFPGWRDLAVVASPVEHPAMTATVQRLATTCELRTFRLDGDGRLSPDSFAECLDQRVGLVVIHHVQNEIGTIQDLVAVREAMRARCPHAVLMADTVQSAGKLPIPWREAEIDLAFVAGHKIGAPTGAALLWHERRLPQMARWLREVRQRHHRLGRPDPAVALTLTEAVCRAESGREAHFAMVAALNRQLRAGLAGLTLPADVRLAMIPDAVASPYILSCRLPPYQGAVLVRMLAERGIMVAAGSACEADQTGPSRTLVAIGVPRHEAFSAMRISFGETSSPDDVAQLLATMPEILQKY